MAGWSTVIGDINTVMVAQGYTKSMRPLSIDSEPESVLASKYSYTVTTTDSTQDTNSEYVDRHETSVVIHIGSVLSQSNEMSSYETLIAAEETIVKALTTSSAWTASTTLNIVHGGTEYESDETLSRVFCNMTFSVYYNI